MCVLGLLTDYRCFIICCVPTQRDVPRSNGRCSASNDVRGTGEARSSTAPCPNLYKRPWQTAWQEDSIQERSGGTNQDRCAIQGSEKQCQEECSCGDV